MSRWLAYRLVPPTPVSKSRAVAVRRNAELEAREVEKTLAGTLDPVRVLWVKAVGRGPLDVAHELTTGQLLTKTILRADQHNRSVASGTRSWSFDAKPDSHKLAADATAHLAVRP